MTYDSPYIFVSLCWCTLTCISQFIEHYYSKLSVINLKAKLSLSLSPMEHSLNPSMGKAVSGSGNEESGWTSYLEDFSKGMEEESYCSSLGGSSLVSDAASSAAWKLSHHNHLLSYPSVRVRDSSNNISKKLRFKKTRTQKISDDDPLEDTASSPVNSPKVHHLQYHIISFSFLFKVQTI